MPNTNEMCRPVQSTQSPKHEPIRETSQRTVISPPLPPTVPSTKRGRVMLRRPSGTYILYGPAGFSECYDPIAKLGLNTGVQQDGRRLRLASKVFSFNIDSGPCNTGRSVP